MNNGQYMKDRELTELAAKAAGIKIEFDEESELFWLENQYTGLWWDPLYHDGDALRLAVFLKLSISILPTGTHVTKGKFEVFELTSASEQKYGDPAIATRYAIVKIAAEIGKAML